MCDPQIVTIFRAQCYSPNSVEKDAAILNVVGKMLKEKGYGVETCDEEDCQLRLPHAAVYVTMGRSEKLLRLLDDHQKQGALVVNSVAGVRICCQRYRQMQLLEQSDISVAPHEGNDGYWVKRGDASAQCVSDVTFQPDRESAAKAVAHMRAQGISEVDVRAHVVGDLVKFYGVCGTPFFRCYYPGDDGQSKFGDEQRNGKPQHYPFDAQQLKQEMDRAARTLQVEVYGGDCIIRPDGSSVLIDFNDWPSFSRCCEEAAQAIATRIIKKIEKKK